jgi:hypothetical protein
VAKKICVTVARLGLFFTHEAYHYNYLPKTSEAPFIFTSLEGCGPLLERGDPLSPMRVAPTLFRSNKEIALTNQQLLYIEDPAGGD